MRTPFFFLASFTLVACGANVESPAASGSKASTLEYVGSCTPERCDGLPVPAIACADPSKSVSTCAPGKDGTCDVTLTCDGSPSDTVSWEACADAACGAAPAIACADGAKLSRQCGKLNGGACTWVTTCAPEPGEPCAPGACGDAVPAIAPICSDGSTGSMVCRKLGATCGWASSCE